MGRCTLLLSLPTTVVVAPTTCRTTVVGQHYNVIPSCTRRELITRGHPTGIPWFTPSTTRVRGKVRDGPVWTMQHGTLGIGTFCEEQDAVTVE